MDEWERAMAEAERAMARRVRALCLLATIVLLALLAAIVLGWVALAR